MNTFCAYFNNKICSSCGHIEKDYEQQLEHKEELLKRSLGDFDKSKLLAPSTSKKTGFRNKAKLVVTGSLDSPIIGLSGEKDLDHGREILGCLLHHETINKIVAELPGFIQEAQLTPYRIKERNGELKGIILFHSENFDETYLRFVLRSKEAIDRIKKHLIKLQQKFPSLVCISANIQPIPHAIMEGEEEIFLTDKHFIKHQLKAVILEASPQSFVQTNQEVAVKLYETAASWIKEIAPEKFAELFSGMGAFSFFAAPHVNQGLGIEINRRAVDDANRAARMNNLQHLNFECADAAEVAVKLKTFAPKVLLVNPPRRGLGEALSLIREASPEYLIYSSCAHGTLGKDFKQLQDIYEINKIQIFDMFPHTEHFETLVLLRLKPKAD